MNRLTSIGAVWGNDSLSLMCPCLMGWDIPISVGVILRDLNSPQLVCMCVVGVAVSEPTLSAILQNNDHFYQFIIFLLKDRIM